MTSDVIVLSARPPGVFDGVGDFASQLAAGIRAAGTKATALAAGEDGWRGLPAPGGRAVILNYVPQDFARGGAAAVSAWLAGARRSGSPVVVVVHEFLPPRDTLRRRVAAVVLSRRLRRVLRHATSVVVTHQVAKDELAALGFAPSAVVIPVGSNIPVASGKAHAERGPFVMFGQPASFAPALVRAIASELAPGHEVRWLTRSAGEAAAFCRAHRVDGQRVIVLAGRAAAEVSDQMASASAALAPIADGVSTRRTSVAAALAHGLPVVGTDGPCTTDALRQSGAFLLTAPGDCEGFVASARAVESGAAETAMMSRAATRLHGELFAWPRIAAAYLELLKPS